MSYDLRFVDSIAASPGVRLNLMAAPWAVQDATEFEPPVLRRSVVSTLLMDGEQYPAAAYGGRTITLVARLVGVAEDATATALQQLYRELNRPSNFLMYRPGTSAPVFFRTFRAGPESVRWSPVEKVVTATIPAEPFAYGLKETLPQVVVSNNPASGGCYFDLTGIKGDVETPLFLRLGSDVMGSAWDSRTVVMGVRRRGTPSQAPMLLQAEAMTTGTGTAIAGANDPLMSGSGANYMRITPAGALMEQRLVATLWPASASVDVRGRYRVLARMRHSVLADVWSVQLAYGANATLPIRNDAVRVTQSGTIAYYDLGTIQFPVGADPVADGYSGTEAPVAGTRITVWAQRSAGSGNLDVDHLMLVPADDRYSVTRVWSDTGASAGIIDGARHMAYAVGASGEIRMPAQPDSPVGGLPMISPGVTNRVVWLVDGGSGRDILTSTSTLTPYYWPRYLFARPPSS